MGPHNLFGRRETTGLPGVRPLDDRRGPDRRRELPAARGIDSAGLADLVLLRRERNGVVGSALRLVHQTARLRIEAERIAVASIGDRVRALDDLESEVEGVAAKDVAHVVAADDHHLQAGFVRDGFQAGGAHLARRPDSEPVAGDHERLAAMDAGAEVGHQIAERAGLPPLIEGLEALGHAIRGRCDLIRVDGVQLLFLSEDLQVPENERLAANGAGRGCCIGRGRRRRGIAGDARLHPRGFNPVHPLRIA